MRIRTIKPEFFDSPHTAEASAVLRLAYIGLWCWADDTGHGTCNPKELEGAIFPNDDLAVLSHGEFADFRGILPQLAAVFGVLFYEVDGRTFFEIPSWNRHQRVREGASSKFPMPDEGKLLFTCENTGQSDNLPQSAATRGEMPPGTGEQGNRGTEEQGSNEDLTVFMSEIGEPITDAPTDDREDVEAVCEHMADSVEERTGKRPRITAKWRTAARLMIDRDKRPVEHIHHAIDWSARDSFWCSNILSVPKLREQYDRLALQAQRGNRSTVTKAEEFRARQRARAEAIDAAYLAQQAQTLAIEGGKA